MLIFPMWVKCGPCVTDVCVLTRQVCVLTRQACVLPGVHHTGNISSQTVWVGQSAQEVQADRAESSNCPVRTAAEDQLVCDGQTGGLRRLRTYRTTGESKHHELWMLTSAR